MARGPRRDAGREAYWREVLTRQRAVGGSARRFCRREGIAASAFYGWRRILQARDRERALTAGTSFLPVVVRRPAEAEPDTNGRIVIELRGGRVMHLPASLSRQELAAVIGAVEEAA